MLKQDKISIKSALFFGFLVLILLNLGVSDEENPSTITDNGTKKPALESKNSTKKTVEDPYYKDLDPEIAELLKNRYWRDDPRYIAENHPMED